MMLNHAEAWERLPEALKDAHRRHEQRIALVGVPGALPTGPLSGGRPRCG